MKRGEHDADGLLRSARYAGVRCLYLARKQVTLWALEESLHQGFDLSTRQVMLQDLDRAQTEARPEWRRRKEWAISPTWQHQIRVPLRTTYSAPSSIQRH